MIALDIAAIVIALLALVLSLVQFMRESSREKKASTIDAFYNLQNDVFDPLNKLLIDEHVDMSKLTIGSEDWRKVTNALAKIEHFSVGINTGVFSLQILNRVAGAYYIRIFYDLKPVIDQKRKQNISNGKHYHEFEQTVIHLKKMERGRLRK
ncbi:MAG: DUF4760 domain-containing protein [Lachnospiraceae bacterium]|nr:DUF4760 domain-containing protein [Lachnospiraceae bacterium]